MNTSKNRKSIFNYWNKTTIVTLLICLVTIISFAQQGINYKAIIKDASGNVVANQNISVKFSILQNVTQTLVYAETHASTTDANGLIILNIGEGTVISGDFIAIAWEKDIHLLKTEIDLTGGTTYTDLGTTEFKAVPYALYAKTAETADNVTGLEAIDEGNGVGWRLVGQDADNYGDIGDYAVDLSVNNFPSSTVGATGNYSTAKGFGTTASGINSTAIGETTTASGDSSTAMGSSTTALGYSSTAMGFYTKADASFSTAIGFYNIGGGSSTGVVLVDPLFEVGNGSGDTNRTNALTILKNGTITAPSFDIVEITDNKALITKEYVDAITSSIDNLTDGKSDSDGTNNGSSVFLGINAGFDDDSTHNKSVGVGFESLRYNTTGGSNTASGYKSMAFNTTGGGNTAIGTGALYQNITGSNNVAIGNDAGRGSDGASKIGGVFIGYQAGANEDTNNRLYIDNSNTANPLIYGEFDTNRLQVNGTLIANGNILPSTDNARDLGSASSRWDDVYATNGTIQTSDLRDKENIKDLSYGLKEVLQLKPIKFQWKANHDSKEKLGFSAQQLQQLIPEVVKDYYFEYPEDGSSPIKKQAERLGVYYSDIIPVLVKAIQEQNEVINKLQQKVEALEK